MCIADTSTHPLTNHSKPTSCVARRIESRPAFVSGYDIIDEFPLIVSSLDLTTEKKVPVAQFNASDPIGLEGVGSVRMTPDEKFGAYSYIRALSELYVVSDFKTKQ